MKRKTWLVIFSLFIVLALGLCACSQSVPPSKATPPSAPPATAPSPASSAINLRFSYSTPPNTWTPNQFLVPWATKVESATNGKVKITHYPAESLHKSTQGDQAITGGITDIHMLVLAYFPGKFPLNEAGSLPFLNLSSGKIDGTAVGAAEVNSFIWQQTYEAIPEMQKEFTGMKVLFVWKTSPFNIFTKKVPVRNMNDLKGLKIRCTAGPSTDMLKALGATPVFIGPNDLYSSLDKGTIDGLDWAWAGIDSYKLGETLNYYTDLPTDSGNYVMAMNLDKWNSLPADVQNQIMSVSGAYGARLAGQTAWGPGEQQMAMDNLAKSGLKLTAAKPDPGEPDKWVQIAGQPVWKSWADGLQAKGLPGQKVIDQIVSLMAKYKAN